MLKPIFLEFEEVIAIHHDQLQRYGGLSGLRELSLLESALAMPATTYAGQYLHHDLFEMAAAYLFHIVANHPFIDGNKRVGAVAALIFLAFNGYEVEADELTFEELVRTVAKGGAEKIEIADFLREHAVKSKLS